MKLNSRSQTNSFSYRNSQMYAPFYKMQMGTSFYNLSVPQYSNTTYNSLAYQGAGIASNSRLGRYQRTNNIQPTSFVPPTETLQITNSTLAVDQTTSTDVNENGIVSLGATLSINSLIPPFTKIRDWTDIVQSNTSIIIQQLDKNNNFLTFGGTGTDSHIQHKLLGTMVPGKPYILKLDVKSDIKSEDVGLAIIIIDSVTNTSIITNKIANIQQEWNNLQILLTPLITLTSAIIKIKFMI